MQDYDACVIGAGGVVGTAIIRSLAQSGCRVVGLERHNGPAHETSSRNSRVIHSGFHEEPDTLKARLARAGSAQLAGYARENGVPLWHTGMLIAIPAGIGAAAAGKEARSLLRLCRSGWSNEVRFRFVFTPGGVRRIAPIRALGGIFISDVFVVDVFRLVATMQRDAVASGAIFQYGWNVENITWDKDAFIVSSTRGDVRAPVLVNSGGLSACTISRMAGGPDYPVEYIRGQYYELRGGVERWQIRTLVYPVAPAGARSKGIHLGPRTDGRLFLGPDATPVPDPAQPPPDTPKEVFLEAARHFVPGLHEDDLIPGASGMRPKYTRPDGVSDFHISVDRMNPILINLIGIDSPGLSSCMAIGDAVRRLYEEASANRNVVARSL